MYNWFKLKNGEGHRNHNQLYILVNSSKLFAQLFQYFSCWKVSLTISTARPISISSWNTLWKRRIYALPHCSISYDWKRLEIHQNIVLVILQIDQSRGLFLRNRPPLSPTSLVDAMLRVAERAKYISRNYQVAQTSRDGNSTECKTSLSGRVKEQKMGNSKTWNIQKNEFLARAWLMTSKGPGAKANQRGKVFIETLQRRFAEKSARGQRRGRGPVQHTLRRNHL